MTLVNEVRSHRWFRGIDWEGIEAKSFTPHFQPHLLAPGASAGGGHHTDSTATDCLALVLCFLPPARCGRTGDLRYFQGLEAPSPVKERELDVRAKDLFVDF